MTLKTFLNRLIWVCMAPLLVWGMVALVLDLRAARIQRDQDLHQRARLTQQYLELKLRTEARALTVMADSLHHPHGTMLSEFYRQAQAFKANFGDHVVLAQQGQMLMNTRLPLSAGLPGMPELKGRSAVSQALATGQAAVGDLFVGPVSQSPLVAMAVPTPTTSQADGLVLLVTMEAGRFQQRLQQMALPEGVHAWLLDSMGRTIAATNPTASFTAPLDFLGARIELPLALTHWSLVLQTDGLAARATLLRNAALWLFALATAAVAAYWAAQRTSRDLTGSLRSLVTPSHRPLPARDIVEVAQVREELQRLGAERQQKEAELRELLVQLGQAQELARKRIALDIHDDLQQTLASLKLSAAALSKADQDGQQALRRELAQALVEQASQAVQSTRRIINDLRPQILDDLGLEAALDSLVARFERETGVAATFRAVSADGDELALEPNLAITLYRVAQEALNNVRKHAQARTVELLLSQLPEGPVELRVTDDGQGLPLAQAAKPPGAGTGAVDAATAAPPNAAADGSGLGLAGMRERMRAVAGTLELRPAVGGGTELVARAPMGSRPAA